MYIADFATQYQSVSAAMLKAAGFAGCIVYAGCNNTAKNCSKARFDEYVNAGLLVGLVIENGATDALGGYNVGRAQGQAILAAAKALGFDYKNGMLATGADWNSTGHEATVVDFARGFASIVSPASMQPGFYGNYKAIDAVARAKFANVFWQSESKSYSPEGLHPRATFEQIYGINPGQATNPTVDTNLVHGTVVPLMNSKEVAPEMELLDQYVNSYQKATVTVKTDLARAGYFSQLSNTYLMQNVMPVLSDGFAKVAADGAAQTAQIVSAINAQTAALQALADAIKALPAGSGGTAQTPDQIAATLQITAKP